MQRYPYIALLALVIPVSCSYYDTSLLASTGHTPSVKDAGSTDAKPDQQQDGGSDATEEPDSGPHSCNFAHPADPPQTDDTVGQDIAIVIAVNDVDFGESDPNGPESIGFDLDARCTCHGDGDSCVRASDAEPVCDGANGQDNAGGVLFAKLSKLVDKFGTSAWGPKIKTGNWGLLFRISGYNGKQNDKQVRLEWYIPSHFSPDGQDAGAAPRWDGSDTWPIRSTCLKKGAGPADAGSSYDITKPLYYDDHAYVSDGWLVGTIKGGRVRFNESFEIVLVGGVLQAKLVQQDGIWKAKEGVLAGRWPTKDILAAIGQLDDPILGNPLCTDNMSYGSFKQQFCAYADVQTGVGAPSQPCDSVSIAMKFTAVQAHLGDVIFYEYKPRQCPSETDPANDSCD